MNAIFVPKIMEVFFMEKSNALRDFCLSLYKIGLALKYEKKPPDRSCSLDSQSDKDRK